MCPISIVTNRMGMVGEQKIDHVTRIKPAMDAASSMLSLALVFEYQEGLLQVA
jgi:hypothetical protein